MMIHKIYRVYQLTNRSVAYLSYKNFKGKGKNAPLFGRNRTQKPVQSDKQQNKDEQIPNPSPEETPVHQSKTPTSSHNLRSKFLKFQEKDQLNKREPMQINEIQQMYVSQQQLNQKSREIYQFIRTQTEQIIKKQKLEDKIVFSQNWKKFQQQTKDNQAYTNEDMINEYNDILVKISENKPEKNNTFEQVWAQFDSIILKIFDSKDFYLLNDYLSAINQAVIQENGQQISLQFNFYDNVYSYLARHDIVVFLQYIKQTEINLSQIINNGKTTNRLILQLLKHGDVVTVGKIVDELEKTNQVKYELSEGILESLWEDLLTNKGSIELRLKISNQILKLNDQYENQGREVQKATLKEKQVSSAKQSQPQVKHNSSLDLFGDQQQKSQAQSKPSSSKAVPLEEKGNRNEGGQDYDLIIARRIVRQVDLANAEMEEQDTTEDAEAQVNEAEGYKITMDRNPNKIQIEDIDFNKEDLKIDFQQVAQSEGKPAPEWFLTAVQTAVNTNANPQHLRPLLERFILTQIDDEDLMQFYESKTFVKALEMCYYGKNQHFKTWLQYLDLALQFQSYELLDNIQNSLIEWSINQNIDNKPGDVYRYPFKVNKLITSRYQAAFVDGNKFMCMAMILVSNYLGYPNLAIHFEKYSELGQFQEEKEEKEEEHPKEHEEGEDETEPDVGASEIQYQILQDTYLNGDVSNKAVEYRLQQIYQDEDQNVIVRAKAGIKLSQYEGVWEMWQEEYLDDLIIERVSKILLHVLKKYAAEEENMQSESGEKFNQLVILQFIEDLPADYLITVHEKIYDFSKRVEKYLPEDKFSWWESIFAHKRTDQLMRMDASGAANQFAQKRFTKGSFRLDLFRKTYIPAVKQFFQSQYADEKELIKYRLNVRALVEFIKTEDYYKIDARMRKIEEKLPQDLVQLLKAGGLYGIDFIKGEKQAAQEFIQRFKVFETYDAQPKTEDLNKEEMWVGQHIPDIRNYIWQTQKIDELLIRRFSYFQEAIKIVSLQPVSEVEDIIKWGLYNDEPMGIYLGQKIAMQTHQIIPHDLAIRVSDYLSYRREIPIERINHCKKILQVIGPIHREFIYDFDKDYHHILVRWDFQRYAHKRNEDIKSEAMDWLLDWEPETRLHQDQPFYYKQSAKRGRLVF